MSPEVGKSPTSGVTAHVAWLVDGCVDARTCPFQSDTRTGRRSPTSKKGGGERKRKRPRACLLGAQEAKEEEEEEEEAKLEGRYDHVGGEYVVCAPGPHCSRMTRSLNWHWALPPRLFTLCRPPPVALCVWGTARFLLSFFSADALGQATRGAPPPLHPHQSKGNRGMPVPSRPMPRAGRELCQLQLLVRARASTLHPHHETPTSIMGREGGRPSQAHPHPPSAHAPRPAWSA